MIVYSYCSYASVQETGAALHRLEELVALLLLAG